MASRTSTLSLTLIDDVTKPARSVEMALKQAEAQVKAIATQMGESSGASDRMVAGLAKLGASKADVESVSQAWKNYTVAQGLAAESSEWTTAQAAGVRAWQASTLGAIRSVMNERRAETVAMRNAATEQAEIQARQLEAQRLAVAEQGGRLKTVVGNFTNSIAGMMAGVGLLSLDKLTVKGGAELTQEQFKIGQLSKDKTELPFANALAADIARQYPLITQTEALQTYQEIRANSLDQSGALDQEKARRNLMAVSKGQVAAKALGVSFTPEDAQNLIKGIEGSGRADDSTALPKMIDAYLKAKQVFGTAIDSSKIRDFVQNAKASNFGMSDPTFFYEAIVRESETNAARLGNEAAQTLQTLVGGHATKQTAKWLTDMGLSSGFVSQGGGAATIKNLQGSDLLQTDPEKWANEVLRPALERKGVLDESKVQARMTLLRKDDPTADARALRERAEDALLSAAISQSGVRSTVADNLAHLVANQRLIDRDVAAMKNARAGEAAADIGQNPIAAFAELTNSISNFAAVVGSPIVSAVSPLLDDLAHGIAGLAADFQKLNPVIQDVAGAAAILGAGAGGFKLLSGTLFNGFGLKGSATALDASAAELTSAAMMLKGGAVAGAVGGAAGGAASAAIPGMWGRLLGALGTGAYALWNAPDTDKAMADQANAFNDWFNSTNVGKWLNKEAGGAAPTWTVPEPPPNPVTVPSIEFRRPPNYVPGASGIPEALPGITGQRAPAGGIGSDAVAAPPVKVDSSEIDTLNEKVGEAAAGLDQLGRPVRVRIDVDNSAFLRALDQMKSSLVDLNARISGGLTPNLNSTYMGSFSASGILGE